MGIHNSIYSFRSKFAYIADLAPVFLFIGITICLLNVVYYNYNPYDEQIYYSVDFYLRHLFDYSFIVLIHLFFTSKNWRFISWACYLCLCTLWILNMIYLLFDFQADIYYMCFVLAIYAIFVIATVAKITNRC